MPTTRRAPGVGPLLAPLGLLLLLALLAPSPPVATLDRAATAALGRLPQNVRQALQLVWLAGSPPLAAALALWAAAGAGGGRARLVRVVAGFLGVMAVEGLLKTLVPTPAPPLLPVAWPWLRHVLEILSPSPARAGLALFRGTFPSGHVARLAYAAWLLAWRSRRRPAPQGAAAGLVALAGAAVVATGGHWLWDAAGGALLGRAAARWAASRPAAGEA
ncbi:MAG: phosphatase PAP2 family protein [Firmicutes bacterium]|nr:phosphatase PAP2 family protein [Bacillota bacterium]